MSPKRQVNHNIRKHFNTIIYNIPRLLPETKPGKGKC